MIGCLNDEKCTYPRCPHTCGLDEIGIIEMLQEQNEILRTYRRNISREMFEIRHLEKRLDKIQQESYKDSFNYYDECSFDNCIHHPAYTKKWHKEYWVEEGCPTRCSYIEEGYVKQGDWRCPYHDDEDK